MKKSTHCLVCMAFAAIPVLARSAGAQSSGTPTAPPEHYRVQNGDTMWFIAAMYYDAPSAYTAIYNINRAAFEHAYTQYVKINPAFQRLRVKGPDTIFPGIDITLPERIVWNGIPYIRRKKPMNRDLAEKVATPNGIDLNDLGKVTTDMLPPGVRLHVSQQPSSGFVGVKPASTKAKREPRPGWFTKPDGSLQQCAKAVCERYSQLCYFECLGVAKRFLDGDVSCKSLPESLPYDIDEESRSCAELLE